MDLQELVARARLLFFGAPKRLMVFNFVNGKRTAKEIARKSGKPLSATLHDLQKMKDMELIFSKKNKDGRIIKKDKSTIYEKASLLRHLSPTYFKNSTKIPKQYKYKIDRKVRKSIKIHEITIPSELDILDICKSGEDQLYEFKKAGTEARTLTKEICAFANTKLGGFIFYGVEDDGTISGSDKRRQDLDQALQNSIRNTISPPLNVKIQEKNVLGQTLIVIDIPPWNREDVYHYEGRVLIRKGTNVFVATPEESRKLFQGQYVI